MATNFFNRELSWLEFNARVLEEAQDIKNPLLERIKFLSIVGSNLDEFFMIRVSSVRDQMRAGISKPDISGITPAQLLKKISIKVHKMVQAQYDCYNCEILPGLKAEGISFINIDELSESQKHFIDNYFQKVLFPVLTPISVDKEHSFPLILNKSLNIAVLMKSGFATVQVPANLDRFVRLPGDANCFILLEDVIRLYIDRLFIGQEILYTGVYRITRNADLGLNEEGAEDLLQAIEKSLKKRRWGTVIRMEVNHSMNISLIKFLKAALDIKNEEIYFISGHIDITFLAKFSSRLGLNYNHLRDEVLTPIIPIDLINCNDIFETVSEKDILFHHPYESFDYIIDFIKRAASDPSVLAIKQTLYRVSGDSPIVKALVEAAENGKQVTVILELKARFDEENNINWARQLERAGCHVIYGLRGLKTHCKMTLIVRQEADGVKSYVHLSTGNYNDVTAKLYTDIGFMTADEDIAADTIAIFNRLSGGSRLEHLTKLEAAPIGLRKKLLELIHNETQYAKGGRRAEIIAKMNALVDEEIISALYDASVAGVRVQLIMRGICCLRPGIPGLSENIRVLSIVDRFLEHSRIFYFYNNGEEKFFLSSADWMNRNFDRRVEIMLPIEEKKLKERLRQVLNISLQDTVKARILGIDGKYTRAGSDSDIRTRSQIQIYQCVLDEAEKTKQVKTE